MDRALHAARAALIIFVLALLSSLVTVGAVGEDPGALPKSALIDDVSDISEWSSVLGEESFVRYGNETEAFSSGEGDEGYIAVRNYSLMSGTPLEISRGFSEPVDLYKWDKVGFYINISDAGIEGAEYVVSVTLYSRGPSYTVEGACEAGDWVRFTADIGGYSMRTDIVGMSVSVTVRTPDVTPVRLSFRLDGVYAESPRDTAHEARFLCPSFESRGGQLMTEDDGTYSVSSASGRIRLTGTPTITGRRDAEYDMIRVTVYTDVDADASLTVTYFGGETFTADSVSIAGGAVAAACFRVDEIENIYSFTFEINGETAATLKFYGVSLITLPKQPESGIGTLDMCRITADGSVNLRGTVPSATVADFMDGDIAVFCVPIYGDVKEYISEAEPVAERDVTTRFDITIEADELPDGYAAMRFLTVICRGDEKIVIAQPKLPTFSEEAGVQLPAHRAGIKGIETATYDAGAAVTLIDADLDELFGTASSGRLFSFGGRIYYFDNSAISDLDSKIKTVSLAGTSCILRLRNTSPRGGYIMTTADSADEFASLAAAVDYLTHRYSSADYGYISGIALGDSVYTEKYTGSRLDRAESMARALSVVYQIGRANIAGFRVILPLGSRLADANAQLDSADLLRLMSVSLDTYGIPYSVLFSSPDPIPLCESVVSYCGTLGKNAPSGYYAVYAPNERKYSPELFADYAALYHEACVRPDITGFILAAPNGDGDEFKRAFSLLDTSEYASAAEYAGGEDWSSVTALARPVTVTRGRAAGAHDGAVGSYALFDFTDSFSTGGWFAVSGDGECVTVRAGGMRALRADEESLGAMYSCAASPLDLSSAPILKIEASTPSPDMNEFELIVYSPLGVFRAPLTLSAEDDVYSFDISEFPGVFSVTGITVAAKGGGTLSMRRVFVCSKTLADDEIRSMFVLPDESDAGIAGEGNMLEIMVLALLALAAGAAAFAAIRLRRGHETAPGAVQEMEAR